MFKNGLFRRANKNEEYGGELSFTKLLKRVLGYLGVPVYDPCCTPPTVVPTGFTQRGNLVQWNSATQTYDNVCVLNLNEIAECTLNEGTTFQSAIQAEGGIFADNGGFIAPFIGSNPPEIVSGPGTLSVDAYVSNIETIGTADAFVMGDGYIKGQVKRVVHYIDGGSAVLTPSNLSGGTTLTFSTVGEFVEMYWNGTDWFVYNIGNTATPGTLPVLA